MESINLAKANSFHHTLIDVIRYLRSAQHASGLPPWEILEIFPYAPYFDRLYSLGEVEKIKKALAASPHPSLARLEAEWVITDVCHIILSRHTTIEEQQSIKNLLYLSLFQKEKGHIDIVNTEFFDMGMVTRIIISIANPKIVPAKDIIDIISRA